MNKTWRLIDSGSSDAATNMATDEALFLAYRTGASTPVLRFYGWRPPAFSIGQSQKPDELLTTRDFVRRPTGGGLLFHDNELTYSFVTSTQDLGLSRSVKESFAHITGFIIETYRAMGLKAHFAKNTAHGSKKDRLIAALCMSRHEAFDILVKGKKIGGHAQKRQRHMILQHGTIPLFLHPERFMPYLKNASAADVSGATCLYEALRRRVFLRDLKNVCAKAFCRHFGVTLGVTDLSPEEKKIMHLLRREKYAAKTWNQHRKISPHAHRPTARMA